MGLPFSENMKCIFQLTLTNEKQWHKQKCSVGTDILWSKKATEKNTARVVTLYRNPNN